MLSRNISRALTNVTKAELAPAVEKGARLVDVRERGEGEAIPGTVGVLPLSMLPGALQLGSQDWTAEFGFEKPQKTEQIIVYCRAGVRAASAGKMLEEGGWSNVQVYGGSTNEYFA